MTAYFELSTLTMTWFQFFVFAATVLDMAALACSVAQKKRNFSVYASLLLLSDWVGWKIIQELIVYREDGDCLPFCLVVGRVAWAVFLFVTAILFTLSVFLFISIVRYGKHHITPNAIKETMDLMPCGICYYLNGGRIVFSNVCMNRIAEEIIGKALANGETFLGELQGDMQRLGNRIWKFDHRIVSVGRTEYHELIAIDVTELYSKTELLKRDAKELARTNRELREYHQKIDETVRESEILQAKVYIHDEMNRLMLSTVAAETPEQTDKMFAMWKQNALLLCREGTHGDASHENLFALMDALGLRLSLPTVPAELSEKQREYFYLALQEAGVNAKKHASATEINVRFSKDESSVCCKIENDGDIPTSPIVPSGGLANLRRIGNEIGVSLAFRTGAKFSLLLSFPKDG